MIQVLRPFKIQPSLVPLGPRLHRKDVGPGLGLAGGVGTEQAAVAQPRQVPLFLRLACRTPDRHRDRPERRAGRENQPGVAAAVSQALHCRDRRQQVLAPAAIIRRHRQALDAEPRASPVALAPELAAAFALDRIGVGKLVPRELDGRVVPVPLRFRKGEFHDRVGLA